MTAPGWVLLGWMLAGIWVPAALAVCLLRRRDHRSAARAQAHRDAAFCAAHAIDWNATAPEKTP